MRTRGARVVRGAAVAAFAAFAAAVAHTIGGGQPPGPVAVALALAFSVPLATLLAGARARLLATTASALATQALLHLVYAVGAPMTGGAEHVASSPPGAGHAGHLAHDAAAQLAALPHTPPSATGLDHGGAAMPVTHLAAAALTVLFLAVADDVLDRAARLLRLVMSRLGGIRIPLAPVPAPRLPRLRADAPLVVAFAAVLSSSLRYRGPPVASVAF